MIHGLAGVLATLVLLTGAAAAVPVDEKTVHDVAAQLRCVVCQSLSVADSPSETANQMRGIIRERLAAGESPAEVRAYFVEKYGEWILLAPPSRASISSSGSCPSRPSGWGSCSSPSSSVAGAGTSLRARRPAWIQPCGSAFAARWRKRTARE